MNDPAISVVLATYNRANVLPRAIASVLAQDADFELIVVDDASTDDTRAYLATLSDPRIRRLAAETNLGPSGARNLGLRNARAPVVAFLDSDDRYRPGRLSAPLAALAGNGEVVCVLSSAQKFDRERPREALIADVKLRSAAFEWALICDLIPVEATSITVRREIALAVGGFCPALRMAEDREFLIRLARHGAGRLLGDVLWEKTWSDDSLSNDKDKAAAGLLAYIGQRPEYLARFPRLASYLATKILVGHLRDGRFAALWRDFVALRGAGLIDANALRLVRRHRAVHRYRRAMASHEALAALTGAPDRWA